MVINFYTILSFFFGLLLSAFYKPHSVRYIYTISNSLCDNNTVRLLLDRIIMLESKLCHHFLYLFLTTLQQNQSNFFHLYKSSLNGRRTDAVTMSADTFKTYFVNSSRFISLFAPLHVCGVMKGRIRERLDIVQGKLIKTSVKGRDSNCDVPAWTF